MASKIEATNEPSLPKLLALDKQHSGFDERIREAANIAGINLNEFESNKTVARIPSRTRSEFVLRWSLEKLKTSDGRAACRKSELLWSLLTKLISAVPASAVARLLQSSGFVKNVGHFLDDCAKAASHTPSTMAADDVNSEPTVIGIKYSKKRKRGEKEPSPQSTDAGALSSKQFEGAVLGLVSVLQSILQLVDEGRSSGDGTDHSHIISSLKTTPYEAAAVLDAWLRCLKILLVGSISLPALLHTHETVLHIWDMRSREHSDETGASSMPFSKHCLVSLLALLSGKSRDFSSNSPNELQLQISLEKLLARHIFVPAHKFFDLKQTTRTADLQKSRAALIEYLEPLKTAIEERHNTDIPGAKALLSSIPRLLDLAIRLSPCATPTQQMAQIPWLESVFAALATCGLEDLSLEMTKRKTTSHGDSPLTSMLHVLKRRDVNLSSDFLETILVACSGLKGLRKGFSPQRLDVVAALLDLNGGVFLKDTASETVEKLQSDVKASQTPYIEALITSLSETKWTLVATPDTSMANGIIEVTYPRSFAVDQILVPLLRAFAVKRRLPSFISLWFWEARRNWKAIGTEDEDMQSPWLSSQLVQAFRDVLEGSLSTSRVGELLVEFILPVRQLLDEVSRVATKVPDWPSIPATAPACAALVILEALLYSVEREESFRDNQAAWLALKEIPPKLACMNLDNLPAGPRIWSIVARVYRLSYFVDGKTAFLDHQRKLLDGDEVFIKARQTASMKSSPGSLALIWVVCGFELDPELTSTAQEVLEAVIERILSSSPSQRPEANSSTLYTSLSQVSSLCILHPTTIPLLSRLPRLSLFEAFKSNSGDPSVADALHALLPALLEGPPHCLEQMVLVLVDSLTVDTVDPKLQSVALRSLLSIPSQTMSRELREKTADGVAQVDGFVLDEHQDWHQVEARMALLLRIFSGGSCARANLCTDAETMLELADKLDDCIKHAQDSGKPQSALALIQLADNFFTVAMQQIVPTTKNAADERRDKFCTRLSSLASERLDTLLAVGSRKKSTLPSPALVLLTKCFLVPAHRLTDGDPITSMLKKKLQKLLWATATHNDLCLARSWVRLKVIAELLNLGVVDDKGTELASQALASQQTCDPINAVSASEIDSALHPNFDALAFATTLETATSAQDSCKILGIFERRVSKLRLQAKLEAVHALLGDGSTRHLQMLCVLLKQLSQDEVSEQNTAKQIVLRLCGILRSDTNVGRFGATMSCLKAILLKKPFLVTQHGIDTLLGTLASLTSPQAPAYPSDHADFIYTSICQLTTSIVLLHRRRLGGRMHLVVALLQNLMTCLFTPHRYQTTSTRPAWLSNDATLGIDSATSYTRVITTLCEPTVSSTTRHHSSGSLVDENKKAKEYAGQYVSYLLLHYCSLQLQFGGGLGQGVEDRLKPGLWAIMGVVDLDAMRGMNAGMGRSERVVWGALWSEWQRVGKFRLN